jgi:acylphosphatase
MKAFKFSIRGVVQGVGFRYFTQDIARSYNINGWVKNELDGSVSGFAEGEENNLANFETSLKDGPSASMVNSFDKEVQPTKGFGEFQIRF